MSSRWKATVTPWTGDDAVIDDSAVHPYEPEPVLVYIGKGRSGVVAAALNAYEDALHRQVLEGIHKRHVAGAAAGSITPDVLADIFDEYHRSIEAEKQSLQPTPVTLALEDGDIGSAVDAVIDGLRQKAGDDEDWWEEDDDDE